MIQEEATKMDKGKPFIRTLPGGSPMPNEMAWETYTDILGCSCGGVYILTSKILLSYPEKFEHKCTKCGNIVSLNCAYPHQYVRPK